MSNGGRGGSGISLQLFIGIIVFNFGRFLLLALVPPTFVGIFPSFPEAAAGSVVGPEVAVGSVVTRDLFLGEARLTLGLDATSMPSVVTDRAIVRVADMMKMQTARNMKRILEMISQEPCYKW